MSSDMAQMIGGFLIAFAYVPQILKMKKNLSSEDISLSFLMMIWIALILMGWYSVDKLIILEETNEGPIWHNHMFSLFITNIINFVMVTITVLYTIKLRR